MKPITIRHCTIADIEASPNLDALLAEYVAESAIPELGELGAQADVYRAIEANGVLRVIAAYQDDQLVGFVFLLMSVLPHFGRPVGTTESLFVAKAARKTGAGLQLIRAAEVLAKELGAKGFFISAPVGGVLERVMPGIGYRETNRVFFKDLS